MKQFLTQITIKSSLPTACKEVAGFLLSLFFKGKTSMKY